MIFDRHDRDRDDVRQVAGRDVADVTCRPGFAVADAGGHRNPLISWMVCGRCLNPRHRVQCCRASLAGAVATDLFSLAPNNTVFCCQG